jgi:hypothetical protein
VLVGVVLDALVVTELRVAGVETAPVVAPAVP